MPIIEDELKNLVCHQIYLVEEREGKLYGYEIKWSKAKSKPTADWQSTYKDAKYESIIKENFLHFVT
ncbi:MAG: hypothetical protein LHV68_07820 [Elusimicrobia bacterium]|nr:hypothetical protein [Candidatus Liberimonas magnetica]